MLTQDEVAFDGATTSFNSTYYLNENATSNWWWGLSPSYFYVDASGVDSFRVSDGGGLSDSNVDGNNSLRAAVSLTSSTKIISGDGTVNNAYIVE